MLEITEAQAAYLRGHQLGVLATSRKDGSPQQSMITYLYDGAHVLISVTKDRAKYHNFRRQPRVSLLVPDGPEQLFVRGTAELLEGLPRDRYILALRKHPGVPPPAAYDPVRFVHRPHILGRVNLRTTLPRVLN